MLISCEEHNNVQIISVSIYPNNLLDPLKLMRRYNNNDN
jgi:hypothetical protein